MTLGGPASGSASPMGRRPAWTDAHLGRFSPLGTQHFMNPKVIAAADDEVSYSWAGKAVRWVGVAGCIAALLVGLYLVVDGLGGLGSGYASRIFGAASHPITGLLLGILATAALQSSTTTTAVTIAAVGSGVLNVAVAVPIILGANVGTTVTAMMAAFSYTGDRGAFRRAQSTASLHAWFNVGLVGIALPLELVAHPLEKLSGAITSALSLADAPGPHIDSSHTIAGILDPVIATLGTRGLAGALLPSPRAAAVACALAGIACGLAALRAMRLLLRDLFRATTATALERIFGASPAAGLITGALGTALIQSSTVTITSLLPFAASHTLRRRECLAVILGANVGTTFTALIMPLALPGTLGNVAAQVALVHVLLNVLGAALVVALPPVRRGLIALAKLTARTCDRGYGAALGSLIGCYFLLPTAGLLVAGLS